MKRKICIVMFSFFGRGVERSQVRMANYYSRNGDVVDVVCFQDTGVFRNELDQNLKIHCLKVNNSKKGIIGLIRYLWTHKPEYVLSAQDNINVLVLIARLFCPWRFKVSVSCRVSPILWARKPKLLSKNWLMKALVRIFYPIANQIVVLSSEMAQEYVTLFGLPSKSLSVIHNPVLDSSKSVSDFSFVDHPWFNDTKKKVVLGVGNLSWIKGFDTLIRALGNLKHRPDIVLIIVGEGSLLDELKQLAFNLGVNERVEFVGFKQNSMDYMRSSDLFVLSSISEGFGNVLVEAIGTGCPVVSTRCGGGAVEIMENGKLGYLVPISNEAHLSVAIEKTLDEEVDKEKLLESSKRFYIDHISEQYISNMS
ncbi:glycosyl transferase group 1 family protein [Vibrio maritimus]|uniref:Glycosyl transferase group 1 family protein n=1 Tax=Vibrio maritimus TaxID=990268 RepID=A0A090TCA0_9VIBR|nr:glycosyl transferase group 1 family protein [Vibrio maritimus]